MKTPITATILITLGLVLTGCTASTSPTDEAPTVPGLGATDPEASFIQAMSMNPEFAETPQSDLLLWGNTVCTDYENGSDPYVYIQKMVTDYSITEAAANNLFGTAQGTLCRVP